MPEYDDVRTSSLALIGLLGAILTFAVVVLVMVVYYRVSAREHYEKLISQAPAELSNVVANQQAKLTEYRWVDQQKGVVTIPIDRAMHLVVAERASDPSRKPQRSPASAPTVNEPENHPDKANKDTRSTEGESREQEKPNLQTKEAKRE